MDWNTIEQRMPVIESIDNHKKLTVMYWVITLGTIEVLASILTSQHCPMHRNKSPTIMQVLGILAPDNNVIHICLATFSC